MVDLTDARLGVVVGGKTIAEHLREAIGSGALVENEEGRLKLTPAAMAPKTKVLTQIYPYEHKNGSFVRPLSCKLLNNHIFEHAYGQKAVPFGCQTCYKVKVITTTMRQLVAMKTLAERTKYSTKSGHEVFSSSNTCLYGTYFYHDGLDAARKAYAEIRGLVDADPKLGKDVKILIKRGCTNYERAIGPSDQYMFDPALEEAEKYLATIFADPRQEPSEDAGLSNVERQGRFLIRLIQVAYQIGDETYLDFTGGKPLRTPTVTYSPVETPKSI